MPNRAVNWGLRGLHHLLLGTWLGSWLLFGLVVAPIAFRVLPSTNVAGQLVGPILDTLHVGGIVAGLALALVALGRRQGPFRIALPLLLAVICAASQFGVTAGIEQVRPVAFGPDATSGGAERFSELHQLSRLLYGVTGVGLILLTLLPARSSPR